MPAGVCYDASMLPLVHRFLTYIGGGFEEVGLGILVAAIVIVAGGRVLAQALYGKRHHYTDKQFSPIAWTMKGIFLVWGLSTLAAGLMVSLVARYVWLGQGLGALLSISGLEGMPALIILVLLLSVLPVAVGVFVLQRSLPPIRPTDRLLKLSMILWPTIWASAGYFLVFLGFMFLTIPFPFGCQHREYLFHEFNGHLKNVCMSYNTTRMVDDCPRNETQLAAFNPRAFSQVKACVSSTFDFDELTKKYTWITRWPRNRVYVSDPRLPDGYGVYSAKVGENKEGLTVYPPAIDGAWASLPW